MLACYMFTQTSSSSVFKNSQTLSCQGGLKKGFLRAKRFTSIYLSSEKRSSIYIKETCIEGKLFAEMTTSTKIEPLGMEVEASLLEDFSRIPSIGKVWMFPTGEEAKVSMEISQKDVPKNSNRKTFVHFLLHDQSLKEQEAETFVSIEMPDILFMSPSPSGSKTFVAKKVDDKKETTIQIWNRASLEYEITIPERLHGPVVNDGWFGNRASWSSDESLVAYVAERPREKETPEWGKCKKNSEEKDETSAKRKGWKGVGEFEEDWGESNTGKQAPAIYVLDLKQQEVKPATDLNPNESYGQPVWSRGHCLIYVCWNHESTIFPRIKQRLGMVYCFNRQCTIMARDWDIGTEAIPITPKHLSAFSPRFSEKGDMVFLSQENAIKSGVHSATPCLYAISADDIISIMKGSHAEARCLQDTCFYSRDSEVFPGLYTTVLPEYSIVNIDGKDIIFITVQWKSCLAVVGVDIASGELKRVSPVSDSSWSFLGLSSNGWIMLHESSPNCPSKISVGKAGFDALNLTQIRIPDLDGYPKSVHAALAAIQHKVLDVEAYDCSTNDIQSFEATLIHSGEARPTLLMPHGGPHSAYSTQFVGSISFMVASGYNILTVNYRGSTGFGEDSLQSLPGKVGSQDVKDCYQALLKAKETGLVLQDQVAVVGGSHGGFLSGHLIGQYPELFKAAVMRNPVCNISLMIHLTDIPDWCFIETFGSQEGLKRAQNRVTLDDLREMEKISPIAFVEEVKAPVLMMLGGADRRVPMDDGKRYIARLRQSDHAPDTRVIVFDNDEHGLTKAQTDFEQWLTALWWLKRMV